jgi:flagellar motor protein MotB
MAAEVTARISAQQAAAATEEVTLPPVQPSLLSRIPRRAVWSAIGGLVGVMLVVYLAALRLLDDETKAALAPYLVKSRPTARTTDAAPVPASPSVSASAALAKALEGLPVSIVDDAGRITLSLRDGHQFPVGAIQPAKELRPVFGKIAAALDGIPGAIVVTGHADASPTSSVRWASNTELSAARARAVAQLMAPKLKEPARLSSEGKGDADPIAPGKSEADRARNRRVTIIVKPNP